jgi:hypothetical protein
MNARSRKEPLRAGRPLLRGSGNKTPKSARRSFWHVLAEDGRAVMALVRARDASAHISRFSTGAGLSPAAHRVGDY